LVGLAVATPALADEPPGEVYTTGWNHRGQLGNGTNIDETESVQVLGLDGGGVVDLAGGRWHSIALADDGTVYTWGRNEFGQLGIGSTGGQRTTAVEVAALDNVTVVDVAAGHYHSLALTDDGDLYIWGRNDTGQLGLGDLSPRGTPTVVSALSNVAVISGGRNHSAVALDDGSVWTFGDNTQLQLADGSSVNMATTPVEVSDSTGIEPIVALKAGRDHTLAVSDDGSLWIWGGNIGGQIGNGTDVSQGVPQERVLGGPVIDAAGGAFHTIVAMADGTVQTWGRNAFGQLGIGTTVFGAPTPQTVPAVSTATSVGSGRDHSLITLADGTALAFGRNDKGQLGDGTTANRNSPVVILGIGDATVVEGGRGHTRILSTIGGGAPDTTAPTGEWLSPINNQSVGLPVTLTGSAEDNIGVDHVEMIIRDLSTGNFWNPSSGTWGGYNRFSVPVDFPGSATTEFSFVFDPPPPSGLTNYRARLWVEDAAGNENTDTLNRNFSVSTSSDTTPPTAAWTSPANGASGPAPILLEGIAEDNVAVDHVELVIRDLNTQLYWDGAAWGTFTRFEVPVADPGSQATTFSYSFDPPTGSGTFRVRVWAVDEAGNDTATTVNRKFSIN
jgi:alpha-tubulin suppressor-like RCC1 family protein